MDLPKPPTPSTTAPPPATASSSEITGGPSPAGAGAVTAALSRSPRHQARSSPHAAAVEVAPSVLAAAGLGGGVLLAWWAVAFRRANAMLWMVPAGLTPLAWLSVLASGSGSPPTRPADDLGAAQLS